MTPAGQIGENRQASLIRHAISGLIPPGAANGLRPLHPLLQNPSPQVILICWMFYLSQRFVLKLLLVLKEGVQAVLLHDDLRLVREEDGVTVERHLELRFAQLVLRLGHEHRGRSDAWQWEERQRLYI